MAFVESFHLNLIVFCWEGCWISLFAFILIIILSQWWDTLDYFDIFSSKLICLPGYSNHLQEKRWKWQDELPSSWVVADSSVGARRDLNVVHPNYFFIEWSSRKWVLEPCNKSLFAMWVKYILLEKSESIALAYQCALFISIYLYKYRFYQDKWNNAQRQKERK